MAQIEGSYDVTAEPSRGFDQLPPGNYEAQVVESRVEDISNKSDKGRCLSLTWKVLNGEHKDRQIWQRLSMWAKDMNNVDQVISIAMSNFAAVREATGKKVVKDSEELHFIPCMITVGPQKNNPEYIEVKSVRALQQNHAPGRAAGSPPPSNSSAGSRAGGAQPSGGAPWPRGTR